MATYNTYMKVKMICIHCKTGISGKYGKDGIHCVSCGKLKIKGTVMEKDGHRQGEGSDEFTDEMADQLMFMGQDLIRTRIHDAAGAVFA